MLSQEQLKKSDIFRKEIYTEYRNFISILKKYEALLDQEMALDKGKKNPEQPLKKSIHPYLTNWSFAKCGRSY